MDLSYDMPTREQYRKEEIGKESQLQSAWIRDKRENTWIQSYNCVASDNWPLLETLKKY